jgi:hypothetical protein
MNDENSVALSGKYFIEGNRSGKVHGPFGADSYLVEYMHWESLQENREEQRLVSVQTMYRWSFYDSAEAAQQARIRQESEAKARRDSETEWLWKVAEAARGALSATTGPEEHGKRMVHLKTVFEARSPLS